VLLRRRDREHRRVVRVGDDLVAAVQPVLARLGGLQEVQGRRDDIVLALPGAAQRDGIPSGANSSITPWIWY
jgi:hypothetical protein